MDPNPKADTLLDKILLFTVLNKSWDYRRIADFSLDETIDTLEEIYKVTGSAEVANKIEELREMQRHIEEMPA